MLRDGMEITGPGPGGVAFPASFCVPKWLSNAYRFACRYWLPCCWLLRLTQLALA